MNLYLEDEHGYPAHDSVVKRFFGLRAEQKWPANGLSSRMIQGILCWVNPVSFHPKAPFQRAMSRCPSCGKTVPIGRLPQHARVHGGGPRYYKKSPLPQFEGAKP